MPEESNPQEEEINPVQALYHLAADTVWEQEVVLECEKDLFLEREFTEVFLVFSVLYSLRLEEIAEII